MSLQKTEFFPTFDLYLLFMHRQCVTELSLHSRIRSPFGTLNVALHAYLGLSPLCFSCEHTIQMCIALHVAPNDQWHSCEYKTLKTLKITLTSNHRLSSWTPYLLCYDLPRICQARGNLQLGFRGRDVHLNRRIA